ncbi:MAG: glycosyltransferase family 4 protein [Pseudobdellovibrionaceae bacterium]|jgi:glycosyltransferase involved in cell wall biosynthesis
MNFKIVHVCLNRSWGGQEMACLEHALWMRQAGLTVQILTLADSELEKQCALAQIPVKTLRRSGYFHPLESLRIYRWIRQIQPHTICFHQLKDLWLFGPIFHLLNETQFFGFSHTTLGVHKKGFFYKYLYSSLTKVLALSEFHKNNLLQMTPLHSAQVAVIPNPVDTEKYRPNFRSDSWRAQFTQDGSDMLLGLIGRLDPQKGQRETLQALNLLWDRGIKNWHLIIVGEDTRNTPGTEKLLREFLRGKDYETRVHFLGFQKNIPEIMASLDLFILPSYGETFGRVVIESMASGTPVLASQAGGVPDLLQNGKYGFLFLPKDIVSLQQQLERVLTSTQFRTSLVQSAREYCLKTYSQNQVEKQILQLLKSSL